MDRLQYRQEDRIAYLTLNRPDKYNAFGADIAAGYFLPRLIGSGRANEFVLTGNLLSADEAMNLGFASRLVSKNDMIESAEQIARVMAGKNPLGLRMTKEAINVNLDAGGPYESYYF